MSGGAAEPEPLASAPRIRLLVLIKGLGPGGAEQLLVGQVNVRDTEAFRYQVAYLVPWKDQLVTQLEAQGVTVIALCGAREWDLRWALRLRRLLVSDPVDVVHTHSPYVAAVLRVLARTLPRARRPALVYTEHNRWPRHAAATRTLNRLTFSLDDRQVAVSDDVRATMPAKRRQRVEVLTHGIDLEAVRARRADRAAVRAELGIADDEVVIGTVANLRREKAYDLLLEAAAGALARDDHLRFVAVGQGPLEDEVRARHERLGLGDRFLLLGYRDDAVRVMSGFDVFTLASRHEGLPVALMDALALGLPIVATAVGGIPEAVTNGVEGLLVPAERPDELAGAYLRLASDEAERARLGAAAASTAGRFDVRAATRRLETIYREAAASRRS